MLRITCPQCGHVNRTSIAATLCDRCGDDISSVAPAEPQPEPTSAPKEPGPKPEPAPKPSELTEVEKPGRRVGFARVALSFLGRLVLAGLAVTLGVLGSQRIRIGTALASDPHIAGSVAILACAAGMIGVVLLLAGSGSRRSETIDLRSRVLGFVLAFCGAFIGVALVVQGGEEQSLPPPIDMPDDTLMLPDDYIGEPPAGLNTGEPTGPLPGPQGPGGEGSGDFFMPEATPEHGPGAPGPPP